MLGIAVRHQAKILQRTVSDSCAEGTTLWKTQKSLMKIACKWFLFLPACHVMVARFACKTFGLLSARRTHTHNTYTHSCTCSGYVPNWLKRKVCPGHGHGSRVCPTLLTANFRIFFSTLCVGVVDCSWSCTHTHTHRCPATHTCSYTTQTACAVATAALQLRLLDLQLVARR